MIGHENKTSKRYLCWCTETIWIRLGWPCPRRKASWISFYLHHRNIARKWKWKYTQGRPKNTFLYWCVISSLGWVMLCYVIHEYSVTLLNKLQFLVLLRYKKFKKFKSLILHYYSWNIADIKTILKTILTTRNRQKLRYKKLSNFALKDVSYRYLDQPLCLNYWTSSI